MIYFFICQHLFKKQRNRYFLKLKCSHVATHPAGDHVIVIGQVNNAQVRTGRPLVFSSGNYGVIEEL